MTAVNNNSQQVSNVDSSVSSDLNAYVVSFETTAVVQCVVKVSALNQQEAISDALVIAEKGDLSTFTIKSVHTDSLTNTSVDRDLEVYEQSAAPVVKATDPSKLVSIKYFDRMDNVVDVEQNLTFAEASVKLEAVKSKDKLSAHASAAIFDFKNNRMLSAKSPRGEWEVRATGIISSESKVESWISEKADAIKLAIGLKSTRRYSAVEIYDLRNRSKPKMVVAV